MSIAEKLITVAENQQRVYDAGKTAEWSELWDGLQVYGGKTEYTNFCANGVFILKDNNNKYYWNFKPKYNLTIKNGTGMFKSFNASISGGINHAEIAVDLTQWLKDLGFEDDKGLVWNTENLTNANTMFYNCQGLTRVPFMDLSKCTASNSLANFCGQSGVLKTIDGIISSENTVWYNTTFAPNNPLKHCIFSGVIGKNFYISNATRLDKESLLSIFNTLSETTSGLTATISQTAVINAFGSTESDEWLNLIATKSNWTISLA